jgi:hypothetical protein
MYTKRVLDRYVLRCYPHDPGALGITHQGPREEVLRGATTGRPCFTTVVFPVDFP